MTEPDARTPASHRAASNDGQAGAEARVALPEVIVPGPYSAPVSEGARNAFRTRPHPISLGSPSRTVWVALGVSAFLFGMAAAYVALSRIRDVEDTDSPVPPPAESQ